MFYFHVPNGISLLETRSASSVCCVGCLCLDQVGPSMCVVCTSTSVQFPPEQFKKHRFLLGYFMDVCFGYAFQSFDGILPIFRSLCAVMYVIIFCMLSIKEPFHFDCLESSIENHDGMHAYLMHPKRVWQKHSRCISIICERTSEKK